MPLIDMSKEDRHCVDNYSIKNFADLITLNTQMTHIQSDTVKYITPDVIMKYFNSPIADQNYDQGAVINKQQTMKRAFRSLQNFHRSIAGNPFYRDKVTFPIYLETENDNGSHDYDFILLSNDLVSDQILDEIKFDDRVTLTFLYLKDMLYPTIKMSNIGTSSTTGYDIRGEMAKFIEFSRNNDTDPMSAMIKLIKIAGMKKTNNQPYNGLINFVKANRALRESISNKFYSLFGGNKKDGEIKDVQFLLKEINHLKIADFFDDTSLANASAHKTVGAEATQASPIERQYMASKTQEYNRILSLVDALINFNTAEDIMVDANDIKDNVIKLTDAENKQEVQVSVNYDRLIDSVRNDYFNFFVESLVLKTNALLNSYNGSLNTEYNNSLNNVKSQKPAVNSTNSIDEHLQYWLNEERSIQIKLDKTESETQALYYQKQLITIGQKIQQLQLQRSLMARTIEEDRAKAAAEKQKKQLTSQLIFNTDLIQSELVGMLHSIEGDLYKNDILQDLINVVGNSHQFSMDELYNTIIVKNLKFSIEQLTMSLVKAISSTSTNEFMKTSEIKDFSNIQKVVDKLNIALEGEINSTIKSNIMTFFTKLGREYGDYRLLNAQKYAELRAEKNPVIRKSVAKENNFKTFIISEKVLVSLYEMMTFTDTQKYLAGLLAYPPSKIHNELNQIKYVLNRLGLEENPIFIVGANSIILSSPDFLSLTGSNVFSKISIPQLKDICKIDYNRSLWNNNQMFKKVNEQIQMGNFKDSKRDLEDLQKAVKAAFDLKSNAMKIEDSIAKNTNMRAEDKEAALAKAKEKTKTLSKAYDDTKHLYDAAYKRYKDAYSNASSLESIPDSQALGNSTYIPPVNRTKPLGPIQQKVDYTRGNNQFNKPELDNQKQSVNFNKQQFNGPRRTW